MANNFANYPGPWAAPTPFGDVTTDPIPWGRSQRFEDNIEVQFGDGAGARGDVRFVWSGSALEVLPLTDNVGAVNFGNGTADIDVKIFMNTTTEFVLFDVSVPTVDFGADDKGVDLRLFGETAGAYVMWDQSADALEVTGVARLDFSGATVAAANTDGGLIKAGTAAARVIEDTADMRFININVDNGATSGDNRAIYNRLYLTGAGGGGESLRSFTTVEDVAAGTAHGAHLSLNFAASGSITGLGVASRNTLHVPNAVMAAGGTYAATQPEIYSDGSASDPSGVTELSFIRVVNDGNATGIGRVDDKAYLITLAGGSIGAGNVVATSSTTVTHSIRVKMAGTVMYLMASTTV